MKSKKEFYSEYFKRLKSLNLSVNELSLPDVLAEIYNSDNILVGVITTDDRLICQTSDTGIIENLFSTAEQSAQTVGACTELPHNPTSETINGYYKLYEYGDVVLACKTNPLFGYEFVTYKKMTDSATQEVIYYYAQVYYNFWLAGQEFAKRAYLIENELNNNKAVALFSQSELSLLLSCCIERIKFDSSLETATEKALGALVEKIEGMLPDISDGGNLLDRLYFER